MSPSTRALLVAAALSSAACSVYESIQPYSNPGDADSSVTPDGCVPALEVCNGKDDDCDGVSDEAEAVALDCASRLQNQPSSCASNYCVKAGPCDEGFYNCDGMPDNGCESSCACRECGDEDAGAQAAR